MKTIHKLILLLAINLLVGCSSNRLESQLLRPNGVLSVVVWSDVPGEISTTAGTTPRVTVLLAKKDTIVVEQGTTQTLLYVHGELWGRLPKDARKLEIRVRNQTPVVEVDGVDLPKSQEAQRGDEGTRSPTVQ